MKRLDRLKRAIRYGNGQAWLLLHQHPQLPADDILITMSLHDDELDPQCGGSHVLYLNDLLHLRPNCRRLLKTIARRFEIDDSLEDWDALQVYQLLSMNAASDPELLQTVHRRFVRRHKVESDFGADAILETERMEGILFLAETYGNALSAPAEYQLDFLLENQFNAVAPEAEWRKMLEQRSTPAIVRFLDALELVKKKKSSDSPPAKDEFTKILDCVRQNRFYFFPVPSFSESQIDQFQELFHKEQRPKSLATLCKVLAKSKQVPASAFERLCALSHAEYDWLSSTAIDALIALNDPRNRSFAEEQLAKGKHEWNYFQLLASVWTAADEPRIYDAFKELRNRFIHHNIIRYLLPIESLSKELLLFLYNRCSCGNCRKILVDKLLAVNAVDSRLLAELAHDSQIEIRETAQRLL